MGQWGGVDNNKIVKCKGKEKRIGNDYTTEYEDPDARDKKEEKQL